MSVAVLMQTPERLLRHPWWVLLGLIALLSGWRTGVLLWQPLPLYVDEAQYWYWAQQLDWGYYSKPPVIAAVIALSTSLCGDGESCVRAGSLVFYPLTTLVLFLLGRQLVDKRLALTAAVLFLTLPAVSLSSLLISTDVVLFFCWTLALLLFVRALQQDRWPDWLGLGVVLGLGLLTKYTMGIFFVSALAYVIVSARWQLLWNRRAWSAVLLAAMLFAPNLWWNWQNGFPTFQHTAEISSLEQAGWHWNELGEFVAGQLLVFGLVFFPLLVWLVLRPPLTRKLPHARLLLCFTLPFLLIICAQALFGRANANWAAPAYVAGSLLLALWLIQGQRWRWLLIGLVLNLGLAFGLYYYQPVLQWAGVPLSARLDVYKRLKGWDELGRQYLVLQQQYPQAVPLASERAILSELAYYARPAGLGIVSWNPDGLLRHHYDLVTRLPQQPGADFLFVNRDGPVAGMQAVFRHMQPVGELRAEVHPDFVRSYQVWLLQDFQGMQHE
ncbi:MAG TPA: glycosyltransferase family 39 protein [Thiolinea sp.]|nr:glycosyltransferase family 39 protein [Thiolinea sp.]